MIHINTKDAINSLNKSLGNVTPDNQRKAISRALNRGIKSGRTAGSKEVRKTYNMSAKSITKATSLTNANKNRLYATLDISGKPISLMNFKPKQTKKGVTVAVKKKERRTINSAFIAAAGGIVGVWARGQYSGGEFEFRSTRIRKTGPDLPIELLRSVSIAAAFNKERVLTAFNTRAVAVFTQRYEHELKKILK